MQKKAIECNTEFPYRIIQKGLSFQNTTKTKLTLGLPFTIMENHRFTKKAFFWTVGKCFDKCASKAAFQSSFS